MTSLRTPSLPIFFFLPAQSDSVFWMPIASNAYHEWLLEHPGIADGRYVWTLLTYLQLKESGFTCELVDKFPRSGIVVSHRDFLPVVLAPRLNVFLVCIKADRNSHPWAHFHIVQNPSDALMRFDTVQRPAAVLPHWPQPNLIPRSPLRASLCRNVAYVGRHINLAKEFLRDDWRELLLAQGFTWEVKSRRSWHDYSDVDVTLSVRDWLSAGAQLDPVMCPDSKPPSKLVNSWLAGVPALAGPESAYRAIRRSALDYIEVTSEVEVVNALQRLRTNPNLFADMAANGLRRSSEFAPDAVASAWRECLAGTMTTALSSWQSKSRSKRLAHDLMSIMRYFSKPMHIRSLLTAFRMRA